jgi:hypothetical protein
VETAGKGAGIFYSPIGRHAVVYVPPFWGSDSYPCAYPQLSLRAAFFRPKRDWASGNFSLKLAEKRSDSQLPGFYPQDVDLRGADDVCGII